MSTAAQNAASNLIDPAPFVGPWSRESLQHIRPNGRRVASFFHCGGGSTMGYKLAGYEVIGGADIDPQMVALYRANHHPKHSFEMGISEWNDLPDDQIPPEFFDLDILDGSPPCSVFSMAGKREEKWGTEHAFREGQATQRLDDLFAHFIRTAKRLQPKVIVAENVKGLILGNAKGYVREIMAEMREAGYRPQLFLLSSARMGVPQARERTFFIATRNDLEAPLLTLKFSETPITVGDAFKGVAKEKQNGTGPQTSKYWHRTAPGDPFSAAHPKGHMFNLYKLSPKQVSKTLTAACHLYHWDAPRLITQAEAIRLQSFPDDYIRLDSDMRYVCGMSVPPYMMQRVALEIGRQVFGIQYNPIRRPMP